MKFHVLPLVQIFWSSSKELQSVSSMILCPYCDPNYEPYQNVDEACRGYDVYMGNPMPAQGRTDPGIRNQIFSSTFQNEDGYYALNVDFITANVQIKCDASWSSQVHDNYNQYVQGTTPDITRNSKYPDTPGKVRSSTTGYGVQTPEMDVRLELIKQKSASLTLCPASRRTARELGLRRPSQTSSPENRELPTQCPRPEISSLSNEERSLCLRPCVSPTEWISGKSNSELTSLRN